MADSTEQKLDAVEVLVCLEPLDALEDESAIFIRCWDCDEIINSNVFPVCDDCVIRHGPDRHWCCIDEDGSVPVKSVPAHLSFCHFNQGYVGRYESVFHRRALTA